MRGVSLDEIAESTKIGTRLLKALEDEQFDLLPGGIFNKGFVRAYAKYLGMDEDQAVADYLQAAGSEEPDVQLIAHQGEWSDNKYAEPATTRRGFPFVPVLVLVVVVAAGFGGWRIYQQHVQEREAAKAEREALQTSGSTESAQPAVPSADQGSSPQSTSETVNAQPSSSAPQASSGLVANSTPTSVAASGFEVEVKTTGRAWVSLKADGKILVSGVLAADQVRTLHADKEIVIWTGNAGATQVSFDGKAVPMQGGANEKRVLVFKPGGLQPTPQPIARPAAESPAQPTQTPSPNPQ
jgi:cytoskeleton protein RodZ